MKSDKKTIGLTSDNREIIGQMMEKNLFKDQIDAAKFALSVAINSGIEAGQPEGTDTTWNVGSFDTDGDLKSLISVLFPDTETPYRVVEYLINAGLEIIGRHLAENRDLVLAELLKKPESPTSK